MALDLLKSNATTISATLSDIVHVQHELQSIPASLAQSKDAWQQRISHLRRETDSAHSSLATLAMKIDLEMAPNGVLGKREFWVLWLLQKRALDTLEQRVREVEAFFWREGVTESV